MAERRTVAMFIVRFFAPLKMALIGRTVLRATGRMARAHLLPSLQ